MLQRWLRRHCDSWSLSLTARFVAEFCEFGWLSGVRACIFLAASKLGAKEFKFPLLGYSFRVRSNCRKLGIDGLLYARREGFEPTLTPHFRLETPESVFLDVGANYGYWSRFVLTDSRARGVRGASIISFEPLPSNYQLLVDNMSQVPESSSRARCEQLAIADVEGTCFLNLSNSDPGSTFASDSGDVECRVTTIDEYVAVNHVRNVSLMKIDVEGFELRVLRGARQTICRDRPRIICEVLPSHLARAGARPSEVLSEITQMGYTARPISDSDYLFSPIANDESGI
jgi:FkbM family methyltransferase